jgi:hypothetical protein
LRPAHALTSTTHVSATRATISKPAELRIVCSCDRCTSGQLARAHANADAHADAHTRQHVRERARASASTSTVLAQATKSRQVCRDFLAPAIELPCSS